MTTSFNDQRRGEGVVLVMPTPPSVSSGPLAVWITAAGWAAAARARWGKAWLVTSNGIQSPEEARELASQQGTAVDARTTWRRYVPRELATLRKDVRDLVRAYRFRNAAINGPWNQHDIPFVWQHHEFFQRAGFRLARRRQCPLVLFVDAPLVWEAAKWGIRRPGWGRLMEKVAERPQLQNADLVACVSEEVADQVQALGAPKGRVIVTPCSVDLESFHPKVSGGKVRERSGLENKFVVGWIGTFRRFHGIDLALQALAIVQGEVSNVGALLVGDGLERARMKELSDRLGLQDVVFTGTVPHAGMADHIAAMDVALVVDPGNGGFHYSPLKLREYMACGAAVVAPDSGQIGRILSHGKDALVVEPGSVKSLAEAILRLYRDRSLLENIGRAAAEKMANEGAWSHQVARVEAALLQQ